MKIKLIGLDLDGTLLNKFKRIPKKNLEGIKQFTDKGGLVSLISGRSSVSALEYMDQIEKYTNTTQRFVCCFNGAYIYDKLLNKEIKNLIDNKLAREIYNYCKKNKISASFYTEASRQKKAVVNLGHKYRISTRLLRHLSVINANKVSDLSSYKINISSWSSKKLDKAFEELKNKYKNVLSFSHSEKHLAEINSIGFDKGYALKHIEKTLELDKSQIAYFGDSFNDVPAFNEAGISFAINPANKSVCTYATHFTLSKKNAIADLINKYITCSSNGTNIRLIATDLDGTLLENTTKKICKEACEKIIDAVDNKNIYFAVATGRNIDDISVVVKNIGIKNLDNCYAIANNGAVIYEFKSNSYLNVSLLNSQLSSYIFDQIKILNENRRFGELGCYIHRAIDPKCLEKKQKTDLISYNLKFVQSGLNKLSKNFTKNNWYPKNFVEFNEKMAMPSCCKFVIYTENPTQNQNVFEYFKGLELDAEVTTSSKKNVEINAKGVNKGVGVCFLADKLGININQTMTLGDEENDISMLSITSNSFTLSSSKEVVKKAASNVIDSTPSIFVANAISKLI